MSTIFQDTRIPAIEKARLIVLAGLAAVSCLLSAWLIFWLICFQTSLEIGGFRLGDGRWIVGDPDDCAAQVRQLRDELGVTDIICTLPPHIGQKRRLQTIELLGRHVIPAFRPDPEPSGV